MTSDKAFEQLKLAALEVKALLIDIDENIQPTVLEMEKINVKVNELSEQIAIYKYIKGQKELSPSLSLHLKVMEKTPESIVDTTGIRELEMSEKIANAESVLAELKAENLPEVKKLEFSLNDKFRIINELFKQSTTEFNLAVDQINSFTSLETSTAYLNELKNIYYWSETSDLTKLLYQINKKRFQ